MSDLEFFGGLDASDKVDPAAFEKFKERMKAAAAQIKAIKVGEQKQKKKEDKIIKILLKFVKNSQKQDIMILLSRVLERNMHPSFVLSIVILGNEALMQGEEGKHLLKQGEIDPKVHKQNQALAFFDKEAVLPLELKIKTDEWMRMIYQQALENAARTLKTGVEKDGNIVNSLIQLTAFILRDFMAQNNQNIDYMKIQRFTAFFMKGIFQKVAETVESQKKIEK
jgi:hypothetical protein